ncbi:hypothetical protein B0T18DRAFT_492092 [Schizothecium vesticola]|uniref:Uncharacterized protein n=1 Tax=Schizothecium vesticola TaxID=314040 RepID=A0AA40EFJ1_9PEZI|nr:hypothetical protein B0T18DRAFT_492092 [Schizothecium vesticola]
MGLEMATVLRDYLTGQPFSGKWYYSSDDKAKNPRLDHIIEGLGYEGVELTKTYWTILRRHNLLRTAEEEEQHRFTAAPLITNIDAGSTFATSVRYLLRACGYACPKSKGVAFHFVQAGQLHLQLFYSETEELFRVHDRWLSVRSAVDELGLPDSLPEADVVFHTVKRLFSDALEQLPLDVFHVVDANDARTTEWRGKLEISLSEQRLLSYLRLVGSSVRVIPDFVGLIVAWGWWPDAQSSLGAVVEIQCHKASRCAHLRSKLLTAEDAHTDNMACMTLGDRDACRVYRDNHRREQARLDVLVDAPPPSSSFCSKSNSDISITPAREPAAAGSPPVANIPRPTSFVLGLQLGTLDIFKVDRERWYEARSDDNVQAVIGILSGEKTLPEESRKRRRLED